MVLLYQVEKTLWESWADGLWKTLVGICDWLIGQESAKSGKIIVWIGYMYRKRNVVPLLKLVNVWVIGGAMVFACALSFLTLMLLWLTRPGPSAADMPTAVLHVIDAPEATQTLSEQELLASATPSLPSPPPGEVAVGAHVQITGTAGDGLRLRTEPGLDGQIRLLGSEAEVFRVDEGPVEMDGYTWWYLVGPFDETRHGWAVANYLDVVQNP
jgi:hypothetical protein